MYSLKPTGISEIASPTAESSKNIDRPRPSPLSSLCFHVQCRLAKYDRVAAMIVATPKLLSGPRFRPKWNRLLSTVVNTKATAPTTPNFAISWIRCSKVA